jgi:hypothetical protein
MRLAVLPLNAGTDDQAGAFSVEMDQIPRVGDQVVLTDSIAALCYRVRRAAWHIEHMGGEDGRLLGPQIEIEPEG